MSAMLQQQTVRGKVDGIISLSPPMLQCRDCGEVWSQPQYSLATNVVLSGCSGWGFLIVRCPHAKIRRCGSCNVAHRADYGEGAR